MKKQLTGAVTVLALTLGAVPALGADKVSIRVEGTKRTLLDGTAATPDKAFTKDGNAEHSCAAESFGGVLESATAGRWDGTFNTGFGDYLVHTVLGEVHGKDSATDPSYWALWRNGKPLSAGLCQTEVRNGDELLMFASQCVFDAAKGACKDPEPMPLTLSAPNNAKRGRAFKATVKVLGNDGKATPLKGATVSGGGASAKTDAKGRARLRITRKGTFSLRATKSGQVRSERERVRVR